MSAHAACDAGMSQRPRPSQAGGAATRHAHWVLAACILASSLSFIDGSVVNVGLPALARSFAGTGGGGAEGLQWVINAYLLPLSALLLLGGAAGDRYGKKTMLIGGVALFALASAACAVAPSLVILQAARALQGVGAAVMLPSSLAILGAVYTGEARGRAVGVWAAAGAVAGAIGPVLGGWLIDVSGWRAMFLLNLPVAFGALVLAWRFAPRLEEGQASPLDLGGGLLATVGLGALTWGLTLGSGKAGWTPPAITATAAGAAMLAGFVWVEKARGDKAMMPLGLFGSRSYIGLSLLTFALYGALGGVLVLVPYLLIVGHGYSGTAAGAALLPFPLVIAAVSPVIGQLAGKIGSRWPLTLGPLGVAAGFALMVRVPGGRYWTELFPAVLVMAIGMAGAVAPLTTAVLSSVDARHTGSASGFNSAVSRAGGLIATALLGAVLASRGEQLAHDFRIAAVVGAAASLVASASAFFLLTDKKKAPPERGRN
jgi:EmrB/QacA subfamily drug resistance transporter